MPSRARLTWTQTATNGGYGSEKFRVVRWLNGFWFLACTEHVSGVVGLRQNLYERTAPKGGGGESTTLNHRLINGFSFFLVKGLIWLGIFIVVGLGLLNSF